MSRVRVPPAPRAQRCGAVAQWVEQPFRHPLSSRLRDEVRNRRESCCGECRRNYIVNNNDEAAGSSPAGSSGRFTGAVAQAAERVNVSSLLVAAVLKERRGECRTGLHWLSPQGRAGSNPAGPQGPSPAELVSSLFDKAPPRRMPEKLHRIRRLRVQVPLWASPGSSTDRASDSFFQRLSPRSMISVMLGQVWG